MIFGVVLGLKFEYSNTSNTFQPVGSRMPPLILFEYPPRANSCLESVFLPRKHTLHNQVYACIHSKILSLIHCTKVYMPISMKACVCIALCICSIRTFPIHTLHVCIDCYRVNIQTHHPYQSLQAAMSTYYPVA